MQKNGVTNRSITAGLFGNALEWYDFIIYAYFAPLFSTLFFPAGDENLALLATFGVFASGFLVRPIGGILLGKYGDSFGRRKALIFSILIMTISTFLIGALPTYERVGIWAPILLTVLRLLQGVAVGGELTSATTFLIEHAQPHRRGLIGSLILCSAFFGMLIGSAMTTFISHILEPTFFLQWGWRLTYFIGAALGSFGIYLRIKSYETPHFLNLSKQVKSLRQILFLHQKEITLSLIFTSVMAVGNYLLIAFATTYLTKFEKFSYEDAMLTNFISLLMLTILIPVFGYLSDKVGRKVVLGIGIACSLILALPIFFLLVAGNFAAALMGELLLSFTLASLNAVIPIIIVEMLPANNRATASSISYNVSQAIFGGTAPIISLLLIEQTGAKIMPGFYLLSLAIIASIALLYLQETYNAPLKE